MGRTADEHFHGGEAQNGSGFLGNGSQNKTKQKGASLEIACTKKQ
jgi:hypothetical protein